MYKKNVIIYDTKTFQYPKDTKCRPSILYPEYIFKNFISGEPNLVYDGIREGFKLMGLDLANYGKDVWNPLGAIIKPGDSVVIKPNLVMDKNLISHDVECLYTQPSVVAAIIDYVLIALKGKGKITVGDAPMQECDFDNLLLTSGYLELIEFYRNNIIGDIELEVVDFRGIVSRRINNVYHYEERKNDGVEIDLKKYSAFSYTSHKYIDNLRITNYDPSLLKQHHNVDHHEYLVSKKILEADVIINVPKPKTHRKGGVTIALKNMVGMCVRKEYLPHHSNGAPIEGGDAYLNKSMFKIFSDKLLDYKNYYSQTCKEYRKASVAGFLSGVFNRLSRYIDRQKYGEGSWYGNDTIGRTIVDLNKILFYSDKDGNMMHNKQRKYLIVADMIISGEGDGPIAPSPKPVGWIAMGLDPVCFDEIIGTLMGLDLKFFKTVNYARSFNEQWLLTEEDSVPLIKSNSNQYDNKYINDLKNDDLLYFKSTNGWKNAFREK